VRVRVRGSPNPNPDPDPNPNPNPNPNSFLLSDENDRVHHFRDALRGQLGRLMSASRQSGDWWTTHANRDTEHTKNFRAAKPVFGPGGGKNQLEPHGDPPRGGCDERSRPFTNWGPNCQLSLASERWC